MSAQTDWLEQALPNQELAERIGWTLLHSLWQVALLALAYAAFACALRSRSANLRYLLACLTLGAMFAFPIANFLRTRADAVDSRVALPMERRFHVDARKGSGQLETVDAQSGQQVTVAATPAGDLLSARRKISIAREAAAFWRSWRPRMRSVLRWITVGWALGVVVLAVRPLWGLITVRRLRHRGLSALSEDVLALARRTHARMWIGQTVAYFQSALVEVPTVVGYFRPIVLLPAAAVTGLTNEQLELVLAHELAHIRRHDYLVNLLQTVIETLLFYHPGMWWVSAQVRRERENCCDDMATNIYGNREQYARALYALELRRGAAAPALAASGGSLVRRIRRLLRGSEAHVRGDRPREWFAGLLTLASVISLLSFGPLTADSTTVASPDAGLPVADASNDGAGPIAVPTDAFAHVDAKIDLNKPWIAVGRVTDADGNPMPGVEIRANAGVGTLFPTGKCTTDSQGRYQLEFGPGMMFEKDSGHVQAATLSAIKSGCFERNLNRQGNMVAGYKPSPDSVRAWGVGEDKLFLPGVPQIVDFVMQPAAVLEGEFVETSHNWSVREQSFYLTGDELPPSSSALTSVTTDRDGRFRVDEIPTGRKWRVSMRVPNTGIDIETQPFEFAEPGVYRAKLLLETAGGNGSVKISLRLVGLKASESAVKWDTTLLNPLNQLDGEGFSQLHRAASGGHTQRVRELLASGANVNVEQGRFRGTPLQYAAHQGHGDTVQALLDGGAKVNARDANYRTPLVWAAMDGHADVIGRLLDSGADVNVANTGRWTPLHYAVDAGHVEAAQLLIDRGADVRARNSQGKTPVDLKPELELAIPWRTLRSASKPEPAHRGKPAMSARPAAPPQPKAPKRVLPERQPEDVIGQVNGRPIRWKDIDVSAEWLKRREQHREKHGHTLDYQLPDDYRISQLRQSIWQPLFEEFDKQHDVNPTEELLAEFTVRSREAEKRRLLARMAKLEELRRQLSELEDRNRTMNLPAGEYGDIHSEIEAVKMQIAEVEESLESSLFKDDKQMRFFAEWYVGNWKRQQALYRKYGGRAIWQQVGPEAYDAIRDFLKENESTGKFTIHDPELRERFWEPYVIENPIFQIPNPERVFEHPWSNFEESEASSPVRP